LKKVEFTATLGGQPDREVAIYWAAIKIIALDKQATLSCNFLAFISRKKVFEYYLL